ncbi:glycosyltransferase family 2 protein [Nitrospira moscoviensis]|nr:glycosyltransferase family 2 protein [Nitrospira moscoviensis]
MKVMIQIPCLNEAATLPILWPHLPAVLPGVDIIETVVVDDGSRDGTADVARRLGATHIVRMTSRRGLAHAFKAGMETCLRHGADIIVNIDADNQYRGEDIAALIQPIVTGSADIVIGDRQVGSQRGFSRGKRLLQRFGSWVVRSLSGIDVPDAASGFRAYCRDAALKTHVFSSYTYTHETLIEAGRKNLTVASVPIRTNPPLRTSRLFKSTLVYVLRSAKTILQTYIVYTPLRVLALCSALAFLPGAALTGRFLYYYATSEGQTGYIQSLVVGIGLVMISVFVLLFGIIADLARVNRTLMEDMLYILRSTPAPPAAGVELGPVLLSQAARDDRGRPAIRGGRRAHVREV